MKVTFQSDVFPLFNPKETDDLKDPCPVFDGSKWHMFGSAGTVTTETWTLFHATAERIEGPWTEHDPVSLPINGSGIAAPGVIFADGVFHMFVQTEFMRSGGRIEHAVSNDGFTWVALPPHHNHRDDPDYEWGIEGGQLVELPDGRVLLNATCFLPTGERGTRQRVFFAIADNVEGPYHSVGPILTPVERGENGHSTVIIQDNELVLFYQSRIEATSHRWRYGIARCDLAQAVAA